MGNPLEEQRMRKDHEMALPTLPAVASRILEILLDADYDSAELAAAIQGDPSMTARLLEVVNSAAMGLRYPVSSVQHAITVLGDKSVRMIVFGMTVRQALDTENATATFDRHMFWKHSTATAAAARTLASHTGFANPEEAYLCGLLHDLGQLALSITNPQGFGQGIAAFRDEDHDDIRRLEIHHTGTSHDEMGRHLGECWQLPLAFRDALALHHDETQARTRPEATQRLLQILAAADYLSSVSGYPAVETRRPPRRRAWFAEVLDSVELDYVIGAMQEEIARMEPLFEYGPEDDRRWRTLFLRTNAELSQVVMELEERHRVQRALNETLVRSRASHGKRRPVDTLLTECVSRFGFDRAWIVEVTPEQDRVQTYAQTFDGSRTQKGVTLETFAIGSDDDIELEDGFAFRDVRGERFAARLLTSAGASSGIVVPVRKDLRIAYMLIVDMVEGHPLPAVDPSIVQVLAEEAGLMVQNHELYLQVSQLAVTDPLTQVCNRRKVMEILQREVQRAQRTGQPMSVAMFDLDHFKWVNDTHGHHIGDRCIVMLTELVQSSIRQSDLFARFGGEEFVLLLPETELAPALQLCERLRQKVEAQFVETDRDPINITVSVGLADFQQNTTTLEEIIARADAALYAAKRNGRNQVAYGSTVNRDTAPCHPASIDRLRREVKQDAGLARPVPRR